VIRIAAVLVATFLLAGIPFGYLIGRAGGVDVRRAGSGNIGATNVMRTHGKIAGALTLALDVAKGAVPVAAARLLLPGPAWVEIAVAFVAVAGHCFSPYLGFRGGKGVATALGGFLVLQPVAAAGAVGVFALTVLGTRMVALGSAAAAATYPAFAWLLSAPAVAVGSLPSAALVLWRHRDNFRRLRAGTEHRLGDDDGPGERP
jgi:glycerol-3-phosphate acyltransferase PlsY